MKKIKVLLIGLSTAAFAFAQPQANTFATSGKLKLETGKKIIGESNTTIKGDFGMGMEMNSTSVSFNTLEVTGSSEANYLISNTLTKMKVDFTMMGQNNSYDYENKSSNNEELSKVLDDKINKSVQVTIDGNTGLPVKVSKKNNKADSDDDISNPASEILNLFGDASDDAVVSAAFELIPPGKKVGDTWADTTKEKDIQVIRKFIFKSVSGNEALLEVTAVTNAVNKLDFQGMEFEMRTKTVSKAETITDINTGVVKQRASVSDITGSFQLMGQDMPISASVKTSSIYK